MLAEETEYGTAHALALACDGDDVNGHGIDVGGVSLHGEALIWRECLVLW